jgi:hypothetical protein
MLLLHSCGHTRRVTVPKHQPRWVIEDMRLMDCPACHAQFLARAKAWAKVLYKDY